jgi:hypothetical protein
VHTGAHPAPAVPPRPGGLDPEEGVTTVTIEVTELEPVKSTTHDWL